MNRVTSPLPLLPKEFIECWYSQLALLSRAPRLPKGPRQRKDFVRELLRQHRPLLVSLWKAYNISHRKDQQKKVAEAPFSIAYLLGFHLNNCQRHVSTFQRLSFVGEKKPPYFSSPPRLLDIGCGSGAWAQSAVFHLRHTIQTQLPLQVDLVDRSRFLLKAAEAGIHKMCESTQVRLLHSSLIDENGRFVLKKIVSQCREDQQTLWIGLSYFWNELIAQPRVRGFLGDWLVALQKESFPVLIFFVEPGREKEAREAQQVRHLFQDIGFKILYPCPNSDPCPMIKTPENWCYSEVPNHKVPDWQPIADSLQLQRKLLATATYVFANPAAQATIPSHSRKSVIVGRPVVGAKIQLLCCNGDSLEKRMSARRDVLRGTTMTPKSP